MQLSTLLGAIRGLQSQIVLLSGTVRNTTQLHWRIHFKTQQMSHIRGGPRITPTWDENNTAICSIASRPAELTRTVKCCNSGCFIWDVIVYQYIVSTVLVSSGWPWSLREGYFFKTLAVRQVLSVQHVNFKPVCSKNNVYVVTLLSFLLFGNNIHLHVCMIGYSVCTSTKQNSHWKT